MLMCEEYCLIVSVFVCLVDEYSSQEKCEEMAGRCYTTWTQVTSSQVQVQVSPYTSSGAVRGLHQELPCLWPQ